MTSMTITTNITPNRLVQMLTILGNQCTLGLGWVGQGTLCLTASVNEKTGVITYRTMSSEKPDKHIEDAISLCQSLGNVMEEGDTLHFSTPDEEGDVTKNPDFVPTTQQILTKSLMADGVPYHSIDKVVKAIEKNAFIVKRYCLELP